jgi:hypothetical protein
MPPKLPSGSDCSSWTYNHKFGIWQCVTNNNEDVPSFPTY